MHPSRAASILATMGALLLLALIGFRAASLIEASLRAASATPIPERRLPVVGQFAADNNGDQVTFRQTLPGMLTGDGLNTGFYSMPAAGGMITRGEEPPAFNKPFIIRNGRVYRTIEGGDGMLNGSPPTETVVGGAVSHNGLELAYSTITNSGRWRLYVLTENGGLSFLGEDLAFYDIDWSPDGKRLVFLVPRAWVDQVFTVEASGGEYRQLTADPARKSSPRWSPDGRSIAYLSIAGGYSDTIGQATPTAPALRLLPTLTPGPDKPDPRRGAQTTIYRMNADGSDQRALAQPAQEAFGLFWLQPGGSAGGFPAEIAYSARLPDAPQAAYLYAIDPASGRTRRAYPPLQIEQLACPASLADGSSGVARITLTNSALQPVDAPLVLRARGSPFHPNEPATAAAARIETVTLQPGETRTLAWGVRPAPGRATYLSVVLNLSEPFPVSEQHCAAANTYLGLPNLPLLPLALPLGLAGMALCLPALLRRKKAYLWLAWIAAPVTVAVLVAVESGVK